jgi:hypothetical protein
LELAWRTSSDAPSIPFAGRVGECVISISWPGGGDIDSVVVAPSGVAFAIEIKTRYHERHLRRAREQAVWLARRGRRRGALPVLCVVRAAGVERCESGAISIDRLVPVLWAVANGMSSAVA